MKQLKVLDLFSGRGGWSRSFRERGHIVHTLDIESRFEPTFCTSIIDWYPKEKYDVVLASPPCTEFTKASMPWYHDIVPDMTLLEETLRVIMEADPDYYVIENVRGAVPYFAEVLGRPIARFGSRYLWGDFPILWAPHVYGKWKLPPSPERAALRAEIPFPLSRAMCRSIECVAEQAQKRNQRSDSND